MYLYKYMYVYISMHNVHTYIELFYQLDTYILDVYVRSVH